MSAVPATSAGGDDQRVRRELLGGAGRLRQHEDRRALADEGGLLGDEVHAVDDRVDEHDVGSGRAAIASA